MISLLPDEPKEDEVPDLAVISASQQIPNAGRKSFDDQSISKI